MRGGVGLMYPYITIFAPPPLSHTHTTEKVNTTDVKFWLSVIADKAKLRSIVLRPR